MAFGGTEAFPELGRHCQRPDCRLLDFLPFKCHACLKVFCLEHRVHESHDCPKAGHDSRKVVVCDVCSTSIETTGRGGQDEKEILTQHARSGKCDPKLKKKPTCGVRRCKEILTFSNCSTCKTCQMKVCLKHRFPADHACQGVKAKPAVATAVGNPSRVNDKFLMALAQRNGKDCGKSGSAAARVSPPSTSRSAKAH